MESPEEHADSLNRLSRILIRDGAGTVEPLQSDERELYLQQLDEKLRVVSRAVIVCTQQQTRLFLAGYIEGRPEYAHVMELLSYEE